MSAPLSPWHITQAASIAAIPCAANDSEPLFRITADWNGGGFGYTLPFADAAAARAWAAEKCHGRAGVHILVETQAEFEARVRADASVQDYLQRVQAQADRTQTRVELYRMPGNGYLNG